MCLLCKKAEDEANQEGLQYGEPDYYDDEGIPHWLLWRDDEAGWTRGGQGPSASSSSQAGELEVESGNR